MPEMASAFTSRRRFIQVGIGMVAAAWAGGFLQSKLFPENNQAGPRPVSFPLSELPVGGTKQVAYAASAVLVMRTTEGLQAFSLVCTHLGCTVEWQEAKQEFHCPCHDGEYDQFGQVISGPPPAPLESVAVRIQGDAVIVGDEG